MKYLVLILSLLAFNIQADAWYTCDNIHGVSYTPKTNFYHDAAFKDKIIVFGEFQTDVTDFDSLHYDVLHNGISIFEDHFGDIGILFESDDITMVGVRYKTSKGVVTEIYQFHHDTKKMLLTQSIVNNNQTQELGMYIGNCK